MLLIADGRLVMVVLPAPLMVDLDKLREVLGTEDVRFTGESAFSPVFDDCG